MKDMIILISLSLILYSQAIIPSHNKATASLAFLRSINQQNQYDLVLHRMKSIRGGSFDSDDEYDETDGDYDEEESESEVDEESESDEEDEDEDEESSEVDEEDEEDVDIEEEEEDEGESDADEEEEADPEVNAAPTSSLPVKVTLKTSLSNNVLIDQSIELTASPTRTVQSLKQSVSRQFKSRPPMDAIVLRLDGQLLHDDTLVQDLVDEEDEDDDEEDEDDEDDDLAKLTIIVDMVPPVDPKFGTEMKERLDEMTNEEVLDAYIANLASMHQNSLDLMQPQTTAKDDEDEEDEESEESLSTEPVPQANRAMQQYSLMLKDQIVEALSKREQELLKKTDTPSSPQEDDLDSYGGDIFLKESMKRRKRRGGATANVKRALQKNLNIVSEAFQKTSLWC